LVAIITIIRFNFFNSNFNLWYLPLKTGKPVVNYDFRTQR
jgi:hypothetical protein